MGRETFKTMCPMNCHPTLCGMKVTVENGQLESITGDPDNPDSQGILCMRGDAAHEIVGNAQRILNPAIRDDVESADWQPSDWNTCLDAIANKMQSVGRESVGFWQGHGNAANDYGFGLKRAQMERFTNLYGCQFWNPAMICWGLGGFGFGITGVLETSTKEDMSAHSDLIILWGANAVSQANTMKHVVAAKRRGAYLVVIDVRKTEAGALADELYLIKPGTDADLALAMMNVIIEEQLTDAVFIENHTTGFNELKQHIKDMTPKWVAARTGITAEKVTQLARQYAQTQAAMIIVGGSSMHKGANTWQAARAISCLPGLTGKLGTPGAGIGPRHGGRCHGAGFADISAADSRPEGNYIPNQMEAIVESLENGSVKVLVIIGSNFLSSFPDTNRVRRALKKVELVVAYDIFSNQTIRETAHMMLPGTIWLEEIGCKSTNTHVYLCDRALPAAGEAKPVYKLYTGLAERLQVRDVYPWPSQEDAINAVLDHPATGHVTVAELRRNDGQQALNISHVAYPSYKFHTPSGKVEFWSERAIELGLPALPMPSTQNDLHTKDGSNDKNDSLLPQLVLTHGRTFGHFHAFYDHGQALPSLRSHEARPQLWISPEDAGLRDIENGDDIKISTSEGTFSAIARVTDRMQSGVVWMRDGWQDFNVLTECRSVLPDTALSAFPFSVGQSYYGGQVDVAVEFTP